MALPLDQFNATSQDILEAEVRSGLFPRTTLFNFATGKGFQDQKFGKPGLRSLTGARGSRMSRPEQDKTRRMTFYEPRFEIAEFGGGGGVGYRGVTPNVTTVDILGAAKVSFTLFSQQIKVMKDDLDAGGDEFGLADLQTVAIRSGVKSLQKNVSSSLWSGNPTQTNKQWDAFVGLIVALDSGSTYPTFYNVNKTTDTFLKPGYFSSTASTFSFDMIDTANAGDKVNANPNGGPIVLGNGVDLALCNETLFKGIKRRAIAESLQVVSAGSDIPEMGVVGFEREMVKYGKCYITIDPHCPAGTSSAQSYLALLSLDSWKFITHPDYDFVITPWTDQEPISRERALTADIQVKGMWVCMEPWKNALFTAVNG